MRKHTKQGPTCHTTNKEAKEVTPTVVVPVVGGSVVTGGVGPAVEPSVLEPSVLGASVLGASVLGASVLGASVLGASVLGPSVLGAAVLGASVEGAAVLGPSVLGESVLGPSSSLLQSAGSRLLHRPQDLVLPLAGWKKVYGHCVQKPSLVAFGNCSNSKPAGQFCTSQGSHWVAPRDAL